MEENRNIKIENLESDNVEIKKREEKMNKKKKRRIGKIVFDIILTILILVVIFETVIGMINMQKINNEEKPVWYLSKKVNSNNLKTETIYNLGLYKIVKTDTAKKTTTTLQPFFY